MTSKTGGAGLEAELNRLRRQLETAEYAADSAARLAEVRIAGLLEERDAAIEHNATLRRRIVAEEERRRELETLIDGARGVLFQAAKRAQQTVEK
jgi:predicted  nucleic acid-binding Zn-ribbon protein